LHTTPNLLAQRLICFWYYSVPDEAPFDATQRTYEPYFKRSVLQEQSWYFHQELDVNLMNEAAKLLLNHWLSMFSKVNTDVNTFDCTIQADWKQENSQLVFTYRQTVF
jgi:tRNA pseudouridine38-40 synthase